MKIGITCYPTYGGSGVVATELGLELAARGHDVWEVPLMRIEPVEADLNELVAKALAGWEEMAGIQLKKDLAPLPKLWFDQEQMLKVAKNFGSVSSILPLAGACAAAM